jgi:hypothetical protein
MSALANNNTFADDAIEVIHLGAEGHPLIVVDNFFEYPGVLVDLAAEGEDFVGRRTDYYPGIRKPVTGDYSASLLLRVEPLIRRFFQVRDDSCASISLCAFSLTTLPAAKLRPIQCVPHIDTHDPNQFAVVHYLCDEGYGGTSFYRHRQTGYENITGERLQDYFRILKQEVVAGGLSDLDYINGDTALFERIANIPVKFNRALIYRSNSLHSGNVSESFGLSSDPRAGRLTANTFIRFSAA